MNFGLSDEQQMLREAAADALSRVNYVEEARTALDGEQLPDLWPVAVEAGWTGLLIGEDHGGAGLDAFDAMLVAEECGKRLTSAGLYGHLMATLVLDGADAAGLEALAGGERRAAFLAAAPPAGGGGWTEALTLGADGTVCGEARFQLDVAGADLIVAVATDAQGDPHGVLLDPAAVEVQRLIRYDGSRPLGHVRAEGAPCEVLTSDGGLLARAWHLGQGLLAADALGVCQAVLDLGVAYAKDRHTFGRPIGSYQAVKHQLVEILRHVDTIRNLTYYAGYAAQEAPQELALAAASARFTGEHGADYATRTCIAVHGGIGATWEHDAPFYWRRSHLSRLLLGGVTGAGDRVAGEIIASAQRQVTANA
ncbi:acyl-CoA dehydrogenase family protein [Paraconexibacter sp.]|uniref:acyl-CoA dehydrogenase family protein n=1 Tax=Paraconexibacter sp. TaxID=2949640 RepID=UPI003563F379